MWKQKLCLGTNETFGLPVPEQIRLFRETGFEAFFIDWRQGNDTGEYARLAKELGMEFQSVHAPFGGCGDLWEENEEAAQSALGDLLA